MLGPALREIAPFPENSERDKPVSFKTALRLNFLFLRSAKFGVYLCGSHRACTAHEQGTGRHGRLPGWPDTYSTLAELPAEELVQHVDEIS